MAGVSFELEGKAEAVKLLAEVVERLEHPAPLFDLIGQSLVASTLDRFDRETGPDGRAWTPSIRVETFGGKTLTDSGEFRGSMTHQHSDEGVAVGTDKVQGAMTQFGGTIKPKSGEFLHFVVGGRNIFVREVTLPARPFLGLDEGDVKTINALAAEYVLQPIAEGGAGAAR